ncbi:glycosyltransferase family 4 protein [Leptospira sp. 201903075]|uniref:glycosyltransferase family 4 protein n=1 Tax=Leptospira chreensis TaxID=2810035 RepID=UPI0019631718|nr:glycosyltransferase family 4 protein [Leptospira chreensis]MBM9591003.1 glycosyltransferase family 4 protein [Leptospira chreensis]
MKRVAFIGNYSPRQCGIATFTTDLCESLSEQFQDTSCIAIAVNDIEAGYAYPNRVCFELKEKDLNSYLRAADFLNNNNVDIVSLQFEYGIFGGRAGSHILSLLRDLHMPIVTTLHTILKEPDPDQRNVLEQLISLSDRIVVMSAKGAEILKSVYNIQTDKIDIIAHGIPDVPFVDPNFHKDLFGVEGKIVLMSFGLISPNKGFENVILSLPKIIKKFPNIVYIILGATHPQILRNEGEAYRISLQLLARENKVEGNVLFYNKFVSQRELTEFIGATDIYITPYLEPNQIVSGTLAYTLGAGKAIISTPYWYAEEMLANDRGILIPFHDHERLGKEVIFLLENEAARHSMRKRAYLYARSMIWSQVSLRYMESFRLAREEKRYLSSLGFNIKLKNTPPIEFPILKLTHLEHMTDDTGILQHAFFTLPNYGEGYTTDDNARALIVCKLIEDLDSETTYKLSYRYLAFLWYAYNTKTKRFRNFMDYQRNWLEDSGSEDSHGRSIMALGTILGIGSLTKLPTIAGRLFEDALPSTLSMQSPRAWAFSILGLNEYFKRFKDDKPAKAVQEELANRILKLHHENNTTGWLWFEQSLSYCNAILPHALLVSGKSMQNQEMIDIGLKSLSWLSSLQKAKVEDGHFIPIGTNGFYTRKGQHARFDQQPVEAQTMVSASIEAYHITKDQVWKKESVRAFEWFLGRNDLKVSLYDPATGGCRDGLHPNRMNENQGAESTLAFLQSLLEMRLEDNILSSKSNI